MNRKSAIRRIEWDAARSAPTRVEIAAEVCPGCGSLDVRAVEPRWFQVDLDRRDQLDDGWAERIEFGCRECGIVWC